MMTREQAIKIAQRSGQTSDFHIFDIYNIIDEIFDDIGSCGKCKHGETLSDNNYVECNMIENLGDNLFFKDWYCANYKGKEL